MQIFDATQADEFLNYMKKSHCGKRNAIIGAKLPVSGGAVIVRALVNKLRSDGFPICSDEKGYWYSEEPADIRATLDSLDSRMASMNRAFFGLLGTYKRIKTEPTEISD